MSKTKHETNQENGPQGTPIWSSKNSTFEYVHQIDGVYDAFSMAKMTYKMNAKLADQLKRQAFI